MSVPTESRNVTVGMDEFRTMMESMTGGSRIQMPTFMGSTTNVGDWIVDFEARTEQSNWDDQRRLQKVRSFFAPQVQSWYDTVFRNEQTKPKEWKEFKEYMIRCYSPAGYRGYEELFWNSVFLANPFGYSSSYSTISYSIYVAGETIYIDIPKSVANVGDIINWTAVNLNKDRLMFVHNKKAQILINQKTIKQMKFPNELTGSIIAFGDNEALHVPTIFNPYLTRPSHKWNYIELLHFDVESEKVSVIRSLPWLKDDDWKFIIEWKMTDYIHFDNKLYLLIKRSIANEKSRDVTHEISIIQLCLDKGRELISSAVEIYFTRPELITNEIKHLIFYFHFNSVNDKTLRYQLLTQLLTSSDKTMFYFYTIDDFLSLFEQTAKECSSGADNNIITLLRYHLRSENGECKVTTHVNCSTKENIVPSRSVNLIANTSETIEKAASNHLFQKLQYVLTPHPHHVSFVFLFSKTLENTVICRFFFNELSTCYDFRGRRFESFGEVDLHINKKPFGFFFNPKTDDRIAFYLLKSCSYYKICTECIMYGLYDNCIWSNSKCIYDDQPKSKTALTVNNCFKIIDITPLIFNSSLPKTLTIQLDNRLEANPRDYIVIQAGKNNCTNIEIYGTLIKCSLNLLQSGEFKIDVSLQNDRYADSSTLSAVSNDTVLIFVPKIEYEKGSSAIYILFLSLLILILIMILIFIAYTKCDKEQLDRLKKYYATRKVKKFGNKSAITRVKTQSASSTLTHSPTMNRTSSKLISIYQNNYINRN